MEGAGHTVLVHAEGGERFGPLAKGVGNCGRVADFGMFDLDGFDFAVQAHGEQMFSGASARLSRQASLGELEFEGADGFKVVLQIPG